MNISPKTPEEYAAALKANSWLARIVADHRKDRTNAAQSDPEDHTQFLYGQCFDTEPEVWEDDSETPEQILRFL